MLGREIKALEKIQQNKKMDMFYDPYDYIPPIIDKGLFLFSKTPDKQYSSGTNNFSDSFNEFEDQKEIYSYYVMPKYGKNLEHLFEKFNQQFSSKTIILLGISILEILEKVHSAGYTYNDLKLDNILIGDENFSD